MDPIKHVIVLMLENHSFDQMIGFMGLTNPDINGVDESRFNVNPNDNSKVYQVATTEMSQQNDPGHDFQNATNQMQNNNGNFVADYVEKYPFASKDQMQEVMGYYPDDAFPALHSLAKNFMVCDNWYGSLPGPTWPNRVFVHTGTSLGNIDMPGSEDPKAKHHVYDQTTIFDLMSEANVSWRIYCDGPAQSLVLTHQWRHLFHYVTMNAFKGDCKRSEKHFPQYVFIEPTYGGLNENDQHPPSNLMNGDALISMVYNAIRSNDKLWQSSLLVILYDENGGFYDHVLPPGTVAPDNHTENFAFDILGFRVPAILVGPNISAGVDHTIYDHTSLLKYLCEKFQLDPNRLGARVPHANTFWNLVSSDKKTEAVSVPVVQQVANDAYVPEEFNNGLAADMLKNNMNQVNTEAVNYAETLLNIKQENSV